MYSLRLAASLSNILVVLFSIDFQLHENILSEIMRRLRRGDVSCTL
jgi:hypothetical protein